MAFRRDSSRWPDDNTRPLTPAGVERLRRSAPGLGRLIPEVETVLSSPLVRAWQTAEVLSKELSWSPPAPLPELSPELPPHKAIFALNDHLSAGYGGGPVALVGHRPNLHELAAYLLTGTSGGLRVTIKKGGAARLSFDGSPEPGTATLRWLLNPKAILLASPVE